MEINREISIIFNKYINKTISSEELRYLYGYFQLEANEKELDLLIEHYFQEETSDTADIGKVSEQIKNKAWNKIQNQTKMHGSLSSSLMPMYQRLSIAASIVFLLFISFYFIDKVVDKNPKSAKVSDILPGKNRATLISSTGIVYNLDGAKEEIIADKTSIHYKQGDVLTQPVSGERLTLITPRGGQYRLTLSDGTRVWLNAASSLVYPVTFDDSERRVELTGEAYFEVAHNVKQPFVVTTGSQKVKVLGTSFNINGYRDENKIVTTLLTGRVQINDLTNHMLKVLDPNEQAVYGHSGISVSQVDAGLYSAWKDGEFRFKATPLSEVLRQLERWYDLEIDYHNIPSDIKIHASINRNKKLSTVMEALEKITDLKFNVEGRSVKLMQ